jgi:DNA invertase Pin-like site-specific DNA recombinase
MVLYARVSTQEQTKGQYPSCDSQIEELETYCQAKGWEVYDRIKDEGHRAGTLKRPGLTHLRWLVETNQVDGVICT